MRQNRRCQWSKVRDYGRSIFNNMKKWIIIGVIAIGIIGVATAMKVSISPNRVAASVSIIGGADGPTSIFLAGKLGGGEDEMADFISITMEEAKEAFKSDGSYVIVDVRRADEFAQGHIPGAINIANEDITNAEPAELPDKDQTIYVYCRSGNRSKQAASKLVAMGYTNVIEFGGIIDWTGEIE